jgi:hypothetical protein
VRQGIVEYDVKQAVVLTVYAPEAVPSGAYIVRIEEVVEDYVNQLG